MIGGAKSRGGVLALALLTVILVSAGPVTQVHGEQAGSLLRRVQGGFLDAGSEHTCAILNSARLSCWGNGADGRLGNASVADVDDPSVSSVAVPNARRSLVVASGGRHSCVILDDDTVHCWGDNTAGQLGISKATTTSSIPTSTAVNLGAGRSARAITAGDSYSCALLDDRSVRCWGDDSHGQLADASLVGSSNPEAVALPSGANAIAAGAQHTCAILGDDSVRCWGSDASGQLGDGAAGAQHVTTPVAVPGISSAVALSAGDAFTCALLAAGTVTCWGDNAFGQIGDGATGAPVTSPSVVALPAPAQMLAAGARHACAVLATGQLACWGDNAAGQLGISGSSPPATEPAPQLIGIGSGDFGLTPWSARGVTAGATHTCVIVQNGGVRCWGDGTNGRLGYGDTKSRTDASTPGDVLPLVDPVVGSLSDLSLAFTVDAPTVPVGAQTTMTLHLTNSGPDDAPGPEIAAIPQFGLALVSSTASQGTYADGMWHVGPLSAGSTATLALTLRTTAAGTRTTLAQVNSVGNAIAALDPDSWTGARPNAADDLASGAVQVDASAVPVPPTSADDTGSSGSTTKKVVKARISLKTNRGKLLRPTYKPYLTVTKPNRYAKRIRVTCKPPKRRKHVCPYAKKQFKISDGKSRIGKKWKGRRFPKGTVVTIYVTGPGAIGRAVRYTVRTSKRSPKRQIYCTKPASYKLRKRC